MYVAGVDRSTGEHEWRPFVEAEGFGHLVAAGAGRDYPVIVPTQFVLDGQEVICHFAAPNPVLGALGENPRAVMSVAGDWAFIPSDWKVVDGEDPALGIPTTYYAAVQLRGRVEVHAEASVIAAVLRRQLGVLQPGVPIADPEEAHPAQLRSIRAVVLTVEEVLAKFKYGGNVDEAHRRAVIDRLRQRGSPGDLLAAARTQQRLDAAAPRASSH